MFIAGWWFTGLLFGWINYSVYRNLKSNGAIRLSQERLTHSEIIFFHELLAKLVVVVSALADSKGSNDENGHEPSGQTATKRPALALLVSVALLVLVAWLAVASDQAALSQRLLIIKGLLVGIRIQALLVGLACGIVARHFRSQLTKFSLRVGNAVIGDKEFTAWALQSALVVVLFVV